MRVALADDAALFREGVARLLTDAGFEVVAKAGDAAELLARVHADPPDVVVVDIRMPPGFTTEGLDAAREIRTTHPEIGVLVLSAHVEPHYAPQLLDADTRGAGYLLKDRVADLAELSDAVRRVAASGLVTVDVSDNGVGGPSGLRGLEDRVAALGGRLTVHSAEGEGTTVLAEFSDPSR